MSRRHAEVLLWALAALVLLLGWHRWRSAEPEGGPARTLAALAAPAEPALVRRERLSEAARTVAEGNPFRLDRAPAPSGFPRPGEEGMYADAPPPYEPPPPPRPQLSVSGIAGPPWRAVLEGVPEREGGVVVQRGDVLGELRIRDVTATTVVVAAPDTTWRLTVRRQWQ